MAPLPPQGLYAPQLAHWLQFYPPGQVLVLNADSMHSAGGLRRGLAQVWRFLGLDPIDPNEPAVQASGGAGVPGGRREEM
jgi:hypothetical protein